MRGIGCSDTSSGHYTPPLRRPDRAAVRIV